MQEPTFTTGARVVVTGETHKGVRGTVTAVSASDFLPVSVSLDNGRRAAYDPSELAPVAPEGFEAVEDSMGEVQIQGPTVAGDGWDISTDWEPSAGVLIWPETKGRDPQLSPAQALEMGRALVAVAQRYMGGAL